MRHLTIGDDRGLCVAIIVPEGLFQNRGKYVGAGRASIVRWSAMGFLSCLPIDLRVRVMFAPACLWLDVVERRASRVLRDERRRGLSGSERIGGIAVDQHLGHGAIDDNHHLASAQRRLAQTLRGD